MPPKRRPLRSAAASQAGSAKRPRSSNEKTQARQSASTKPSSEDSSSSSSSDEEDEDDEEDGGELSAGEADQELSFEFSDFSTPFLNGIDLLVKQLLKSHFAFPIAEKLVAQEEVGTVVHCENEVDVFAFASLLPLADWKDADNLPVCHAELMRIASVLSKHSKVVLSGDNCGWLVHSKFRNLPSPLSVELFRNLQADLEWIRQQSTKGKSPDDARVIQAFHKIKWMITVSVCADAPQAAALLDGQGSIVLTSEHTVTLKSDEDEAFRSKAAVSVLEKANADIFSVEYIVVSLLPVAVVGPIAEILAAQLVG